MKASSMPRGKEKVHGKGVKGNCGGNHMVLLVCSGKTTRSTRTEGMVIRKGKTVAFCGEVLAHQQVWVDLLRRLPSPAESVVPRFLVDGDGEIANDAENAVIAYLNSAFVHVVEMRDFRSELGRRPHRCRTYHSIAAKSNVRQTRQAKSLNLQEIGRAPVRIHATSTKMPTTPTSENCVDGLCF